VDHFVANSEFIARRIRKVYGREAAVIHPPVDVDAFTPRTKKQDFYLTASRLVPYKKVDVIVEAFNAMPDKHLVVVGDGPCLDKLKAIAGPNIELLGYQPHAQMHELMQDAKAFVFAAEEDFGITPVEAQACGTPVIAFGKGGALETVVDLERNARGTGMFFYEQTPASLVEAVEWFERMYHRIDPGDCRANAERFSRQVFRERFGAAVERCLAHGAARPRRKSQEFGLATPRFAEPVPLARKVGTSR
jgi:glycosyltransferase involved in cell wall biosynthesis